MHPCETKLMLKVFDWQWVKELLKNASRMLQTLSYKNSLGGIPEVESLSPTLTSVIFSMVPSPVA